MLQVRMAADEPDPPQITDIALLTAWQAGDRRAGDRLFQRYFDLVRRFFVSAVGNQSHVHEDLVQETFRKLVDSAKGTIKTDNVRRYLFGIARHVLADHYRAAYREKKHGEPDTWRDSMAEFGGITPSEAVAAGESARIIAACIQRLPVDSQVMMQLHYWEGFSLVDIGEIFEMPPATVRTRLHRARQQLKELLQRELRASSDETEDDSAVEEAMRVLGALLSRR